MTVTVTFDQNVTRLLQAVGLLDADGHFDSTWFGNPVDRIRRCLADPAQKAALFELLDELLEPDPDSPPGSTWHPLLDRELLGNVHVTVTGDVVGVAAAVSTPEGIDPSARLRVQLPLVDTAGGDVTAIAGTAKGPLELVLDLELGAGLPASGLRAHASVDLEGHAEVKLELDGVQVGSTPRTLTISTANAGRDLVTALETLLRDALGNVAGDATADHLFGVLGLDPQRPTLPIERLVSDPTAIRAWIAQIASTPALLRGWLDDLSGLLGGDPTVAGLPLRAPVVDLGGGVAALELTADVIGGELVLGLAFAVADGGRSLEAAVDLLAIPLAVGSPVRPVPGAAVHVVVRGDGQDLVPLTQSFGLGAIHGGLSFDGHGIRPELVATGVVIGGQPPRSVDLTDVNAVTGVAVAGLRDAIAEALGGSGPALALLALVGIEPPRGDTGSPHLLTPAGLAAGPTGAIAAVHRAVLGDPAHPWSHMLEEIGHLFGLTAAVSGNGTPASPWTLALASDGTVEVDIAAWDARAAADPAGDHRLRLGLLVRATSGPWSSRLLGELLAFDLPASGGGAVRLVGRHEASVRLEPIPVARTADGLELSVTRARLAAEWTPGLPLSFEAAIEDLQVSGSGAGAGAGPLTLRLPAPDGSGADLGLGAAPRQVWALLRVLALHALQSWGGDGARAVGSLLGLDDALAPLEPPDPDDLRSLLADPGGLLRDRLRDLLLSADPTTGEPVVERGLSAVLALLRGEVPQAADGFAARLDVPVTGAGTYADPWALPLASADGEELDVVAWLDPEGPPAGWAVPLAAQVRAAADAATLLGLLPRLASVLDDLPAWPSSAQAPGLEALSAWLAAGDGVVALASQLPGLPGWTEQQLPPCPHDAQPRAPEAIAAITEQLATWAAEDGDPPPVLLLGPAWTTHAVWNDLLAAAGTAGANFDLRGGADPATVTTVATHYTADLDASAAATLDDLAGQAAQAADRILELTGTTTVAVVGHSTGGLVARALATARPQLVRGIVTLATPHAGEPPAPLASATLADAVRLARDLGAGALEPLMQAALTALDAALDGVDGAVRARDFGPVTSTYAPGLALGSALGGELVGGLAAALAARLDAIAGGTRAAPTHVGLGLRARLPLDLTDAGGVAVTARLRLDALRVRFAPSQHEPARPPQALGVRVDLERPGDWLVGGAVSEGPQIRSASLSASLTPGAGGGIDVAPTVVLRDASLGTLRHDVGLGDDDLDEALEALANALGLTGAHADLTALQELASSPATALLERRDALLDALGGPLTITVGGVTVEISLDRSTWQLRVRTLSELPLGDGAGLRLDGRLGLLGSAPELVATLRVGVIELAFASAGARLTLSADEWLDPLTLHPPPPPGVLEETLVPAAVRLAASTALSAVLGEVLESADTVRALDRLVADPGGTLTRLTGAQVHELLQGIASALGLDPTNGLPIPGGLLLAASGTEELRLTASWTLDLDQAGDTLALALVAAVAPDRSVAVEGDVTLHVDLPGDWQQIDVAFGVGTAGVTLSVTPEGTGPITLLPHFSGWGDLVAAGTATVLPQVLQELHDAFDPPGAFGQTVLAVAGALGIYAPASGFTGAAEVAQLRAMLQPGWLETEINDPAALAQLVTALFGTGKIELPTGHSVAPDGDLLAYTAPLPAAVGGAVTLEARLGAPITVRVGVENLDLGPLVVEDARAGFDGELDFAIGMRLDPDGDLGFLRPGAELGFEEGRLSAALLPLGGAERNDLALNLAPVPALVATTDGLLALLAAWGLPLVTLLGLQTLTQATLNDELWSGGPSPRRVLEGAQLLKPANQPSDPPELLLPLAPLEAVALGAVNALAAGISVQITPDLALALVDDGTGRKGVRLKGHYLLEVDDGPDVELRFGYATWLDDADAGVTLWALRPLTALPFVELDPGLDLIGLGAVLGDGADDPLIEGVVTIGRFGGLLFVRLDFLDGAGNATLAASDFGAALEVIDAQIKVASEDGDSFIQKLLPKQLQAPFTLAVEGRAGRGVEVHGGIGGTEGALELTWDLNLDIGGVILLRELFIGASRDGSSTVVVGAISANAALGPLAMTVDRVGARVRFGSGGTQVGFKPPDGFGLSISTPTLTVGGFLLVDEVHGRYVGAVEISIVKKFSLVAVAIITTKKPDGSPGFSLLVLIAIRFPVPIPLGYGFFFAGAGGLLGLNRSIDLDRLRLGLRSGTADSILFPTDVIKRIDTIVRDLEESFPIAEGHFLIAPMAMITYSSPPLVTAKVGIIIEIGAPLRLALLGVLQLALPDPSTPVVSLKVAFLGAIDIPGSMLSFDASIYDSYIGYDDFKLRLEGDIAFRICWGATPDFVMSVGGFHPSYRPAAHLRLPELRRMALILMKDNPRIALSAYFAVTSNTVQFGARLELVFKAGGFSIEGDAGLDVLVQIVPLHLEAHLFARLSVKAGGSELLSIDLDLTLQGPAPWIAHGRASFSILFVTVHVTLDATMGEEAPATLPEVAVLPQLVDALKADAAWGAQLSADAGDLVALIAPPAGQLVLDAAGQLTVRQRLLPLGLDISLFGTARPTDVSRVTVHELVVGTTASPTQAVLDAFAPAAFKALSDREKLTSPAFEAMSAGVQSVTGAGLKTDSRLGHSVDYEALVFDSVPVAGKTVSVAVDDHGLEPPGQIRFEALVPGGAIGTSAGSVARARRDQEGSVKSVATAQDSYGVVAAGDLVARNAAGGTTFATGEARVVPRSAAEARRDALNASRGARSFEILPEAQLVAA